MDDIVPSIHEPLVSVLMTAYNREKYIAEAIESVLASTYTNFELIVVDDCSNDATLSIVQLYAAKDKRIKSFTNETNLGQFANRNKAASYATGLYLKYVDSDDLIYPYTLQMMVHGMQQFPEAALGFCLTMGPCKNPLPYKIEPASAFQEHYFEGGLLFVGPSGLIIKRDAFNLAGGFEEFGMPSDNHLTLKIAGKFPVVALPRDLFWWRLHEGQVYSLDKGNYYNILYNFQYNRDIILKYSPLSIERNNQMLKNQHKIFFLNLFKLFFKKYKVGITLSILKKYFKP